MPAFIPIGTNQRTYIVAPVRAAPPQPSPPPPPPPPPAPQPSPPPPPERIPVGGHAVIATAPVQAPAPPPPPPSPPAQTSSTDAIRELAGVTPPLLGSTAPSLTWRNLLYVIGHIMPANAAKNIILANHLPILNEGALWPPSR